MPAGVKCDWFPCDKDADGQLEFSVGFPIPHVTIGNLCEGHVIELTKTLGLYRMGNVGLKRNGVIVIPRESLSAYAAAGESEPMPSQQPAEWQDE